ncbi:L30e-like protein [Annulohypoxylon maeteangense]|uniref:L30e-like protein n=1 Tax=Annulohypoxylon maeteangense TaxID=1927788 RepID=UPI002008255F|nr:L30e-like protein [Annulohypoxylon maeteangense]KAI0885572.1 L30e-like protein [Annulohypoxylon maeteangense]
MGSTKPEKKEKKDKKRSEADGVTKVKKDKKEKKDKKDKLKTVVSAVIEDQLQADSTASVTVVKDGEAKVAKVLVPVVGALVPFAKPLADEKATKKVMKTVRKAAKHKTLKRGVKEVVKSLRKSPASGPGNTSFPGVVVLAGDISPMDVISHIPVLCEDVNVPYIFVTSRAELGAAGSTKRPTSVVMVTEKQAKSKKDGKDDKIDEEEVEDFAEAYKDLVKLVEKESKHQLKFT